MSINLAGARSSGGANSTRVSTQIQIYIQFLGCFFFLKAIQDSFCKLVSVLANSHSLLDQQSDEL